MRLARGLVLGGLLFALTGAGAEAVPLLQLDMKGGVYDPITETIVAPGGPFELFALLTPKTNASAADIAALLNTTFYISVALSPQVGPAGANLGSFTFGQTGSINNYSATSGMTYGTPPIEYLAAAKDPGDLAGHGIFPTYFVEYAFKFSAVNTATQYNTMDNPGGPTPSATGTAFYASFLGNSSLLASGYNLHFDLYDEIARQCNSLGICKDIDVNRFAPFSHDASTRQVPEPSTVAFLVLGSAIAAASRYRRRGTNAV